MAAVEHSSPCWRRSRSFHSRLPPPRSWPLIGAGAALTVLLLLLMAFQTDRQGIIIIIIISSSSSSSSSFEGWKQQLPTRSLCGLLPIANITAALPANFTYMRERWRTTRQDWELALAWLLKTPEVAHSLCDGHQARTHVLLFQGSFVMLGADGLLGSPQGEHIQWHDLTVSLLLLGYAPVIVQSAAHTPLSAAFLDAFDVVITDYNTVAHAGLDAAWVARNKCKLRILDSWETSHSYNDRPRDAGAGPYCCLQLPSLAQYWTFTPSHGVENSFLGYAVKSFRPVAAYTRPRRRRRLEVVLYAKEWGFLADHQDYIAQLQRFAPVHATAKDWPDGALPAVRNHGVLPHAELHDLMQQTFVYAGFPAVMMGPAALEAMANGMVFLNYAFDPPWNLSQKWDKPITQLWSSQFPFLEDGCAPHAVTINPRDPADVAAKLAEVRAIYRRWWGGGGGGLLGAAGWRGRSEQQHVDGDAVVLQHVFLAKTRGQRGGYVPFEYSTVGMLLRVDKLMRQQVACAPLAA